MSRRTLRAYAIGVLSGLALIVAFKIAGIDSSAGTALIAGLTSFFATMLALQFGELE